MTTDANALVREVHPRMPVILRPDSFGLWLDEQADREDLLGLLRPYPAERMEGFPVSPRVNSQVECRTPRSTDVVFRKHRHGNA